MTNHKVKDIKCFIFDIIFQNNVQICFTIWTTLTQNKMNDIFIEKAT